jgi:hypothetical protein
MTVEQLLEQLAKKGKKVKVMDGNDDEAGDGGEIEEDLYNNADKVAGPKSGEGVQRVQKSKRKPQKNGGLESQAS